MALFRSLKKNRKKANGSNNDKKDLKYVWLASQKATFLIVGEPRKAKYSYGVQIIPLYGLFKSTKEGKIYDANELKDYNVVLNLPKDADVSKLKGKRIAVVGYKKDEILIEENDEEKI
jgi:hypothetical protein